MNIYNPYWKEELVLTAAVYIDDGQEHQHQPNNIRTGFVVTGHRHHNCLTTILILGYDLTEFEARDEIKQGFLTTKNNFLTRDAAGLLAFESGQRKELVHLFSEDLY